MAKKIRVHQLAKEVGVTNSECLEIVKSLGIGATSHSSSMEEPQADRVRRKAEREGLVRKEPPVKKATKTTTEKKTTEQKQVSSKAATTKAPPKKPVAKKSTATTTKKAVTVKKPKAVPTEPTSKKLETPKPKAQKIETKIGSTRRPVKPTSQGKGVAKRRPPPRVRPNVGLPSSGRISLLSQKGEEKGEKSGQRQVPPNQLRRRRTGRRRRRAPLTELQPGGDPEYSSPNASIPSGVIVVERGCTLSELAPKLNRTPADIIKYFFEQGESLTSGTLITDELIELYCLEIGAEVNIVDLGEEEEVDLQKLLEIPELGEGSATPRNPIVTVMGHVDHGKTQLLDTIRNTNVIGGEKGGITQHIGAYQVTHKDSLITFIDTPGHEAFTAMRARGAEVTDLVILVVAADDGVKPQTIEAINHAKSAGAPIVVAINKIDLENKNVNLVLQQLTEQGLVPESYGGDIQVIEISAKEGTGIEELLERVVLIAELEELKTTVEGRSKGVVLESELCHGQGAVSTFLITQGKLSVGDPIVAGSAWGKVRALINDQGQKIKEALPSMPVQVLGLSHAPKPGTEFACAPNDSAASKVAKKREEMERKTGLSRSSAISSVGANLEDVFSEVKAGNVAILNLIIKADASGSLEAVSDRLESLKLESLKVIFVHKGVGGVGENDIQLAVASNASIIGFNIRPEKKIRDLAQDEGVEIRTYEVIYSLIEDVEDALKGLLVPEIEEIVTGEAEVKQVFHIKGMGSVAGCVVNSGKITQGSGVRFLRDGAIIWKGEIKSLKRFTDDAKEVAAGNECGIGLSDFQDLKPEDIIETFEAKEIPVSLKHE